MDLLIIVIAGGIAAFGVTARIFSGHCGRQGTPGDYIYDVMHPNTIHPNKAPVQVQVHGACPVIVPGKKRTRKREIRDAICRGSDRKLSCMHPLSLAHNDGAG